MVYQFSDRVRNARNNVTETTIGPSPTLELRSGAVPANPAAANTGTVLATMVLPDDWRTAAVGGVSQLAGAWNDAAADATGTFGHFRIIGTGSIVDWQGTVSGPGGGGDIVMDSATVTVGQQVTIVSMALIEGNA